MSRMKDQNRLKLKQEMMKLFISRENAFLVLNFGRVAVMRCGPLGWVPMAYTKHFIQEEAMLFPE